MARMAQGTPLKWKDSAGNALKVGDKFTYDGADYTVSQYGSALDSENVANPISKMEPAKIVVVCAKPEMFSWSKMDKNGIGYHREKAEATKEGPKASAKRPTKKTPNAQPAGLAAYTDQQIAEELRKRGFCGTLEKKTTLTI